MKKPRPMVDIVLDLVRDVEARGLDRVGREWPELLDLHSQAKKLLTFRATLMPEGQS